MQVSYFNHKNKDEHAFKFFLPFSSLKNVADISMIDGVFGSHACLAQRFNKRYPESTHDLKAKFKIIVGKWEYSPTSLSF